MTYFAHRFTRASRALRKSSDRWRTCCLPFASITDERLMESKRIKKWRRQPSGGLSKGITDKQRDVVAWKWIKYGDGNDFEKIQNERFISSDVTSVTLNDCENVNHANALCSRYRARWYFNLVGCIAATRGSIILSRCCSRCFREASLAFSFLKHFDKDERDFVSVYRLQRTDDRCASLSPATRRHVISISLLTLNSDATCTYVLYGDNRLTIGRQ